jgi:hypothetical protein
MICDNLVFGWLIERVELFGGPRVSVVSRAAWRNPEGAAGDGAADGAALVDSDGYGGEPLHDMAAANTASII